MSIVLANFKKLMIKGTFYKYGCLFHKVYWKNKKFALFVCVVNHSIDDQRK